MTPQRCVTESKEHFAFQRVEQELLQNSFTGNFACLPQFKRQKILDEISDKVVEATFMFFKRKDLTQVD